MDLEEKVMIIRLGTNWAITFNKTDLYMSRNNHLIIRSAAKREWKNKFS